MRYLNGQYYVEVKDHRCRIRPTEIVILSLRDEPKSHRTQYHVQNCTRIRKNQKLLKNDNDELVVKIYPKNKKQQIQQHPKFKASDCPSCRPNIWLELIKDITVNFVKLLLTNKNFKLIKMF